MSLLRQGKAHALTIYLGESDQWQGKPAYVAIIQFLRDQGCAGATVTRAVAGYGAGARLHESAGLHWSSEAPVIIQVIDQPGRLRRLLPSIQEMLSGGLMTLHEVNVLKYSHARLRGLSTKLPVRQIMETSVITVSMETPIATVIDLLLQAPFRALPVIDDRQKLLGIIGTRDLIHAGFLSMRRGMVRKALQLDARTSDMIEDPLERARQSDKAARDVMNRKIRTIGPDTSIRDAARLMLETGLRRLPVVEPDGILLGMVTRADLLQAIMTSPLMSPYASNATQPLSSTKPLHDLPVQQQPIAEYASPEVATVSEQTPLAEMIDALIISPLKRVIVVDAERRVKGIIGDVDVLAYLQEESHPGLLRWFTSWARGVPERLPTGALGLSGGRAHVAADIMNREVVTVSETTTVQETIERMMATGRKVLPVIDAQEHLVGVVGRADVLRVLIGENDGT